jgi:Zn-dependent protease with chaperone function
VTGPEKTARGAHRHDLKPAARSAQMAEPFAPRRHRLTLRRTPISFDAACRRAHELASRHPTIYRLRVGTQAAALLCLPFATLFFEAVVTLAFPWAFRHSEILGPIYSVPLLRWTVFAFVYATWIPLMAVHFAAVFRALTLRLPLPGGMELTEKEAPRLFRMLGEMSRSLDAPAVDRVRVLPDRHLEIRRVPRSAAGVFGSADTVLLAGLPMLEELSPQHLRALLAHEMAHQATYNRRSGGHLRDLRTRLGALRAAAEASALDRGYWSRLPDETLVDMLDGILRRLAPATFPAVRQHECEADTIAASIAGGEFCGAALLRQRIAGHALTQEFREDCLRLAETSPEPPLDLFERRAFSASGAFHETQVHSWLLAELEHKDNLAESHPPLWDRMRLLGYRLENMDDFRALLETLQPHRELGETAARYFLGEAAGSLRAAFFQQWKQDQARDWRTRFETYEGLRNLAMEWENGSAARLADPKALWQIAVAIGNTRSWRAALPVAQRILQIQPGHGDANLLVGQLLIEEGNRAGLESFERAMTANPGAIPVACAMAGRFLDSKGEPEAAAAYRTRAEARQKAERLLAEERSHVRATDTFSSPCCPAAAAQSLRLAVESHSSHVRAAFLMRKQRDSGDRKPLHVLGIERRSFLHENSTLANRLLLERIMRTEGVPGDILVCVVTRRNRALLDKWRAVPDALLYPSAAYSRREALSKDALIPQFPRAAAALLEPAAHSGISGAGSPAPEK